MRSNSRPLTALNRSPRRASIRTPFSAALMRALHARAARDVDGRQVAAVAARGGDPGERRAGAQFEDARALGQRLGAGRAGQQPGVRAGDEDAGKDDSARQGVDDEHRAEPYPWRQSGGTAGVMRSDHEFVGGRVRGRTVAMRFRPGARLDPGQVQDRRGGGGGAWRGRRRRARARSCVVVVLALLGVDVPGGGGDPYSVGTGSDAPALTPELPDRRGRQPERGLPDRRRRQLRPGLLERDASTATSEAPTRFFSGQTGDRLRRRRRSAVGPFYCPADQAVYIDLTLLRRAALALRRQGRAVRRGVRDRARVRAPRPAPARAPTRRSATTAQGETSGSVRLELQADCYAGVWAAHAVETGFIEELTDADIADGLDAAAAVGDDRIQKAATGRVDRESWTHGSSASRQKWFKTGYRSGDPNRCDTFAANAL